jgi:hypothetical protein
MNTQRDFDEGTQTSHVSTGRLPPAELVRTLVAEAHGRYNEFASVSRAGGGGERLVRRVRGRNRR